MKRAAEKRARPSKPRRAKQTEIPGTERKDRDEAIEAVAEDLRLLTQERLDLQTEEGEKRKELRDVLKKKGIEEYVYRDPDGKKRCASRVAGEDSASVRLVKEPKSAAAAV